MRWLSGVREKWLAWRHDNSGVAAIFTMIIIAVLLGFAAMVIDVGHVMVARGELQNAADSAALAGARGYFPLSQPSPAGPLTPNCTTAKNAAVSYVNKNYADTLALQIDSDNDIKTGVWTWGSPGSFTEKTQTDLNSFKPSGSTVLAIQVTVRKNPGALNNNPVAMSLASLFGVTEMNVQAAAVAVNDLPLGGNILCGTTLFALPECAANAACNNSPPIYPVIFGPDGSDSGGWASYLSNPNASDLRCQANMLAFQLKCSGATDPNCGSGCEPAEQVKPCPGGTSVYVQNGKDDTVIQTLADSLVRCGSLTLLVPLVQGGAGTDCSTVKWTGTKCLVGYATLIIDPNAGGHVNPTGNPDKWVPPNNGGAKQEIKGYVLCNGDSAPGPPGPAGSDYYGTVSLVPKLVR